MFLKDLKFNFTISVPIRITPLPGQKIWRQSPCGKLRFPTYPTYILFLWNMSLLCPAFYILAATLQIITSFLLNYSNSSWIDDIFTSFFAVPFQLRFCRTFRIFQKSKAKQNKTNWQGMNWIKSMTY